MARVSKETMSIGILAILFGLIAAYGIRALLMKKEEVVVKPPPPPPTIVMPLAGIDLPADRIVAVGDVSLVHMSQQQFYQRFKGMEFTLIMISSKDIIGRRLREPVKQGQPFLTTALYLQGTGPNLTDKLQSGFRAISLQVAASHGGNVQSGTHVDVLFRSQARTARAGQPAIPEMTVILLRHIEVLEVDRSTPGGTEAKSLVTLAVPEGKAGILSAVEGRGELWLVATPPQELQPGGLTAVAASGSRLTLEDILGIQPPEKLHPPPVPFQTAIFRRGNMQVNTFVDGKLVSYSGRLAPAASSSSPPSPVDCPGCKGGQDTTAPLTPIPDSSNPPDASRAAPAAPGEPTDERPTPVLPPPAGKNE